MREEVAGGGEREVELSNPPQGRAAAAERRSLIALTWTFFFNLITSLIPDEQNVV